MRVVVVSIEPGSPAEKLGLQPTDVLAHIDSQPITDVQMYTCRRRISGGTTEIGIDRAGEAVKISAPAGLLGMMLKDELVLD